MTIPSGHRADADRLPLLRMLTVVQHALFGVLLIVSVGRALWAGAAPAAVAAGTAVVVAWYLAGAVLARRAARPKDVGRWWLLGLTAGWLGLLAVSPEFAWLAFALWLLAAHFLGPRASVGYTGAVLAVTVGVLGWTRGAPSAAEIVGPTVGALFALGISWAQHQLVRDDLERRRLLDSLLAAQAEAADLQDQLVAAQHEAGVLEERTRLSRDIHDTVAQRFSSIVLLARTRDLAAGPDDLDRLLGRIETSAHEGLDETRAVVSALAPRDLEDGLPAALGRLLDALAADTGIGTELRVDGDVPALPMPVRIALLRTAQGALANVRRHSGASRVVVTLSADPDETRLDIADDGRGFVAAGWLDRVPETFERGGYGLPSTRARLVELGGDLTVESAPGEGTAVSASVPVAAPRHTTDAVAHVAPPTGDADERMAP